MLLFCVKTIVRESHNFELACLKKDEEKPILAVWATFWFSSYFCNAFFVTLGVFLVTKTLEDERYIVIKVYMLNSFV